VGGDAGVLLFGRGGVACREVDIDVEHLHGLGAADIVGIGLQEASSSERLFMTRR
jgi:hypothetical protein